jgi:hypothetical protein
MRQISQPYVPTSNFCYVFPHREYAGPLPLCGLANVTVSQATRIQIDKIRLITVMSAA